MKNPIVLLFLLAFVSCSTKEKHHHEEAAWPALDSFHKIMAEAYHPLDTGNVEPAKELASKLADEAERWASSSLPDQVNTDEMKSDLSKLKIDARLLADTIAKGASDIVVKIKLTELHEQFHHIIESWEGGHDEEGEEHHDDDEDDD